MMCPQEPAPREPDLGREGNASAMVGIANDPNAARCAIVDPLCSLERVDDEIDHGVRSPPAHARFEFVTQLSDRRRRSVPLTVDRNGHQPGRVS